MRIVVVGTSNSLKEYGYTFVLRNSKSVDDCRIACIGKSVGQLYLVTTKDIDFSGFDYCIIDFSVNEHVFHGWGLALDRIETHLRSLVAEALSKNCLPVILLLPRRECRADTSKIREFYIDFAARFNLPIFDGISVVDRMQDTGIEREDLFRDGGHILEWVGLAIGNQLLAALKKLPPLQMMQQNWLYKKLSIAYLADLTSNHNIMRRSSRIMFDRYVSLSAGEQIAVPLQAGSRVVGIYSNLAACGGILEIQGGQTEYADLRNGYRPSGDEYVASVLALPTPVYEAGEAIYLSVLRAADCNEDQLPERSFILTEGRSLPNEETLEIGGLVIEPETSSEFGFIPSHECRVRLENLAPEEIISLACNMHAARHFIF
jgi:hypothetical protein